MAGHACYSHRSERYNASRTGQVQIPLTLRAALSFTDPGAPSPSLPTNQPPITTHDTFEPRFELTFTPRAGVLEDAIELSLGSGDERDEHGRCRRWQVDVCACAPHATLVPPSPALYSTPTSGASRFVSGPVRNATLRGTFASSDARPHPAHAAQISFALSAASSVEGR